MKCPVCGAWSVVKEVRETTTRYRRRRECANEHKFTTEEIVVPAEKIRSERAQRVVAVRQSAVERTRKSTQKASKT